MSLAKNIAKRLTAVLPIKRLTHIPSFLFLLYATGRVCGVVEFGDDKTKASDCGIVQPQPEALLTTRPSVDSDVR